MFYSVDMDVWCYRISVACDIMIYHKGDVMIIWNRSPVTHASVVHSTWHAWAMWQTHASTFNKWQKKKEKKNQEGDIPHVDTWCNARVWVAFMGDLH